MMVLYEIMIALAIIAIYEAYKKRKTIKRIQMKNKKKQLYIVKTRLVARDPKRAEVLYKPAVITGLFYGYTKLQAEIASIKALDLVSENPDGLEFEVKTLSVKGLRVDYFKYNERP
ncbi:MAG TPA: hypothetical protein VL022_04770 [Moheibacter sp.]|nr:hypothetical protein [Moheibacter sp.]